MHGSHSCVWGNWNRSLHGWLPSLTGQSARSVYQPELDIDIGPGTVGPWRADSHFWSFPIRGCYAIQAAGATSPRSPSSASPDALGPTGTRRQLTGLGCEYRRGLASAPRPYSAMVSWRAPRCWRIRKADLVARRGQRCADQIRQPSRTGDVAEARVSSGAALTLPLLHTAAGDPPQARRQARDGGA